MWGSVESPHLGEEIGLLSASSVAPWVTFSTSRRAGNGHGGVTWPSSGSLAFCSNDPAQTPGTSEEGLLTSPVLRNESGKKKKKKKKKNKLLLEVCETPQKSESSL